MSASEIRAAAIELRLHAEDGPSIMSPACARLLADLLDEAAARRYHTPTPPDHALNLARSITGSTR